MKEENEQKQIKKMKCYLIFFVRNVVGKFWFLQIHLAWPKTAQNSVYYTK